MSLPDTPQTRTEQYLNAIANGQTSGIPSAPQTRMEKYLDYIAKNGSGSGSGVLVAHATIASFPTAGAEPVSVVVDKSFAELAAADNSAVDVTVTALSATIRVPREAYAEEMAIIYALPIIDSDGAHAIFLTIAADDSATIELSEAGGDNPFVLHGTITDQQTMSGTVLETAAELAAAIDANRRIIFEVTTNALIRIEMTTVQPAQSGEPPYVSGLFPYFVGNTPMLAHGYVATPTTAASNLVFGVNMYTLTPVSGS